MIYVTLSLLLLSVSIIGFRLTREPTDLVSITLDKKEVNSSEALSLRIRNFGFKSVHFGSEYEIFRVYSNGTIKKVMFPDNFAWAASLYETGPLSGLFGSYNQNVYFKHLEFGQYYVVKEFTIVDIGEYSKTVDFTVK